MDFAHYWFGGGGDNPIPFPIGESLRFRRTANSFLRNTSLSVFTNSNTTISFWCKISYRDNQSNQIFAVGNNPNLWGVEMSTGSQGGFRWTNNGGTMYGFQDTSRRLRDPGAWYHVVLRQEGNASTVFINGVQTRFDGSNGGSSNTNWVLGNEDGNGNNQLDGYLAEFHHVDGTALDCNSFGEFNADGVWVPINVELTQAQYGANGFYLDFSDPNDIGADRSGNGNDFTPSGFELANTSSTSYDLMVDSPTNNWTTWNSIGNTPRATLTNANLTASGGGPVEVKGTQGVSEGKWYWEITGITGQFIFGIANIDAYTPNSHDNWRRSIYYYTDGNTNHRFSRYENGSRVQSIGVPANFVAFNSTDILQVAFDADTGNVWFGRNDSWADSTSTNTGDPATGANPVMTLPDMTVPMTPLRDDPAVNTTSHVNFGQRPFQFTPPAGFEPMSTAELPRVDITNPSEHFQTLVGLSDPRPNPPQIGDEIGGGFFAGLIRDGDEVFELIVAPPSEGNLSGENALHWGNWQSDNKCPASPNGDDLDYGGNTTFNLGGGSGQWLAFEWIRQDANGPNAGAMDLVNGNVPTGTGIGGYNDWYMPSLREALVLYWSLKPTTVANTGGWIDGSNPSAFPPTPAYTASNPAQTSVASFREGGVNALGTLANGNYWTASLGQRTSTCAAWMLQPAGTEPGSAYYNGAVGGNRGFRVVRRQFAFNAGILEQAQAAFPNGLWWIKDRQNNNQHQLMDSVRGGNLALDTPATGVEHAYTAPSGNSVAWCWNLVADRSNGFDIVTYQGTGSARTVAHNLGEVPEYIITRKRDNGGDYFISYHVTPGPEYGTQLNSYQSSSNQAFWNNTAPTASVFTVGTENSTNASGANYVAYLWRSIPGYSAMGGYQGNGSEDGVFIHLGFKPAYVYIKNWGSPGTEAGIIYDSTRSAYNPNDTTLFPQNEWSETYINSVYSQPIDMLSNGFKIRGTESRYNNSSYKYFYVAFAEHPMGGGNVAPSPAR